MRACNQSLCRKFPGCCYEIECNLPQQHSIIASGEQFERALLSSPVHTKLRFKPTSHPARHSIQLADSGAMAITIPG